MQLGNGKIGYYCTVLRLYNVRSVDKVVAVAGSNMMGLRHGSELICSNTVVFT